METPSIQDLHSARRGELFVGRADEVKYFQDQVELAQGSLERKTILHISGQAGMGKSWLLERWRDEAHLLGCITGISGPEKRDPIGVMEELAASLPDKTYFREFIDRADTYRVRRDEIDSDPECAADLKFALARLAATGAIHLAVGGAADPNAGPMVGQAANVAVMLAQKFVNSRGDIPLVQDPIGTLTPIFMESLAQTCEESPDLPAVLFVDGLDRSSEFLEPWLLRVLNGEFGDTPGNVLICTAGQQGLLGNQWIPHQSMIGQVELSEMKEAEAIELAERIGLEDPSTIEEVVSVSGGMPLIAASLSYGAQTSGGRLEPLTATTTAVERILESAPTPNHRTLALWASVPRAITRESVETVAPDASEEEIDWLFEAPFVRPVGQSWFYHRFVREQMIKKLAADSPRELRQAHTRCAELGDGTGSVEVGDSGEVERIYHRVATGDLAARAATVSELFERDIWLTRDGLEWATAIGHAEFELGLDFEESIGPQLFRFLVANAGDNDRQVVETLSTSIVEEVEITPKARAIVLANRARAHFNGSRYRLADEDLRESLALDRSYEALVLSARFSASGSRHDEAIKIAEEASELAISKNSRITVFRVMSDVELERHEPSRAMEYANRAVELDRANASALVTRARAYHALREPRKAIREYRRAMQVTPQTSHVCLEGMARCRRDLDELNLALSDLGRALAEEPYCASCWTTAGRILRKRDGLETAVATLLNMEYGDRDNALHAEALIVALRSIDAWEHVEELAAKHAERDVNREWFRANLAEAQCELGNPEAAIAIWEEIDPQAEIFPQVLRWSMDAYLDIGDTETSQMLIDELAEYGGDHEASARVQRALLYAYEEDWDSAIALNRELIAEYGAPPNVCYNLAVALKRSGADAEAEIEFARKRLAASDRLERSYGTAGLFALESDFTSVESPLEDALSESRHVVRGWISRDPAFAEFREDPRYAFAIQRAAN